MLVLLVLAFSPLVPLLVAHWCGVELDSYAASSSWLGVLPWLLFWTNPGGAGVLLGWIVYGAISMR